VVMPWRCKLCWAFGVEGYCIRLCPGLPPDLPPLAKNLSETFISQSHRSIFSRKHLIIMKSLLIKAF
jgi:hypothetical protein